METNIKKVLEALSSDAFAQNPQQVVLNLLGMEAEQDLHHVTTAKMKDFIHCVDALGVHGELSTKERLMVSLAAHIVEANQDAMQDAFFEEQAEEKEKNAQLQFIARTFKISHEIIKVTETGLLNWHFVWADREGGICSLTTIMINGVK